MPVCIRNWKRCKVFFTILLLFFTVSFVLFGFLFPWFFSDGFASMAANELNVGEQELRVALTDYSSIVAMKVLIIFGLPLSCISAFFFADLFGNHKGPSPSGQKPPGTF